MKIACIGNMNNMMLPISLYLAEEGHEVVLFLLDEYEHFIPDANYTTKLEKVVHLGWNASSIAELSKSEIRNVFSGFSFFIGTDYSPAILAIIGVKLNIFFPAGSDITHWPFKKFNTFPPQLWEFKKVNVARNQFFGIQHCHYLSMDRIDEYIESLIYKIRKKGNRMNVLPFFYIEDGAIIQSKFEQPNEQLAELKNEDAFIVLQHGRQAWCYDTDDLHNKGNDILFEGVKLLLDKHKDTSIRLVLLEYGQNIEESKNRLEELGIAEYVTWIKPMHRDKLVVSLGFADIIVGNLNFGFYSYGAVYETLVNKIAFMGKRTDGLMKQDYTKLYNMINVSTPQEVCDSLAYYQAHPNELQEIGKEGFNWITNEYINPSVKKVLEIVDASSGVQKLPKDWKRLLLKLYFPIIYINHIFVHQLLKRIGIR